MSPRPTARFGAHAIDVLVTVFVASVLVVPYVLEGHATLIRTAALLYRADAALIAPMLACPVAALAVSMWAPPRLRAAGWIVAALPAALLALLSWRAVRTVASTPLPGVDATMHARTEALEALVYLAGDRVRPIASVASTALLLGALVFAGRARRRGPAARPLPRVATLGAGAMMLGVVGWWCAVGFGSTSGPQLDAATTLIVVLPAALGIAALVLAQTAPAEPEARSLASADMLASGLLSAASTAAMALAAAISFAANAFERDSSTLATTTIETFERAVHAATPLAVAPLVAAGVAVSWRPFSALDLRGRLALVLGVMLLLLVAATSHVAIGEARACVSTAAKTEPALPPDLTLPVSPSDGERCEALVEKRLLAIGRDRVHLGGADVGPITMLDDPAACDRLVDSEGPLYVAVDPTVAFGRVARVLAAQGRAIPAAHLRDQDALGADARARCGIEWLGRADPSDGGDLTCAPRLLSLAACFDTDSELPDQHFELRVAADGPIELRRWRGVLADSYAELSSTDLAPQVLRIWETQGNHRDPSDRASDKLIVAVASGLDVEGVLRLVAPILELKRARRDRPTGEGAIFHLGFGAADPPSAPLEIVDEDPRAKVSFATPPGTTAADAARLQPAVHAILGQLEACFGETLGAEATGTHELRLAFYIDVDGRLGRIATSSANSSSTPAHEKTRACLASKVEGRTVALPGKPSATGSAFDVALTVTYP